MKPLKALAKVCVIIIFVPIIMIFFYFLAVFGLIRWQLYNSAAFNKQVSLLPCQELVDFSSRCDDLWAKTHTNHVINITNTEILNKFTLLGKTPKTIEVFDFFMSVQYIYSGRFGAIVTWTDNSMWGEPTWELAAKAGDKGSYILYELQKTNVPTIKTNTP